uniref:NAC domain-containing protein n=1 Tax=Oryza barthii TaxID=65489 RepID=A0A0D3FX10_9ORYZ
MASSAHMAAVLNLPWGYRFRPSDRQIIANYLGPMAIHGADSLPQRGDVVEGVDVFATRPAAIPFEPRRHEYRLNKSAAAFRRAYAQPNPKANMDCVVREIYTKAVPPPTPPSGRSGDEEMQEGSDYSVMDEDELVDYLLQGFEDGNFDEDQDQPAAAEDGDYSDEDQDQPAAAEDGDYSDEDQDQPAAAEDGDYSDEDQDQPAAAEDGDYSDEDEP